MSATQLAPAATRVRLGVEFLILFVGLVGGYALVGSPGSPIPPLVLAAVAAVVYLRRQSTFDSRDLLRAAGLRAALPSIVRTWSLAAVALVAVLALVAPERLFDFPREEPVIWAFVVVFYPLLSVYPQELVYRAFLLHRYAPVLGTGAWAAAASAAVFGFAHIIFGSWISVAMTAVGGWLFARRYQLTRSLLAASVEHALYGVLIFTIGLGDLFYHAAPTS
ncbi:CPBP family intramembrane glutamic endopeptidase [Actinomycetes bacterium KLBMP 9797]